MDRHGTERVEDFLDVVTSLDNLIDPYSPFVQRDEGKARDDEQSREVKKIAAKDYMDRFINPPEFLELQKRQMKAEDAQNRKFPARPMRDVLKFLLDHAPLELWQQDILAIRMRC
jgi:stage V sporulation protein R